MKIFLDVGGHNGETLNIALNPIWGFDSIHSFEPSVSRYSVLKKFRDKRLHVHNFGLGAKSEYKNFYGAGTVGGSIYSNKNFADKNSLNYFEVVEIVEASSWILNNTNSGDQIFLKMNCEGSEADVLENLIDTEIILRISSIYVIFDVSKIPGQEFRQVLLENTMKSKSIDFNTPEELGHKGERAVEEWLTKKLVKINVNFLKKLIFMLKFYMPNYLILKLVASKILPKKMFIIIVKKFGRFSKL
jgi:FkbM family methyltransferase